MRVELQCVYRRLRTVITPPDQSADVSKDLRNSVTWGDFKAVENNSLAVNDTYKTIA